MKYICRIGTNPSNDLVISDRTAADYHAQLILEDDNRVFIQDLDSRFGTRLNNQKVALAELKPGDDLRIGFASIDWEKIVNDWQVLNEAFKTKKQLEESESERLSLKLASEAGKLIPEYEPGEIQSRGYSLKESVEDESDKYTDIQPDELNNDKDESAPDNQQTESTNPLTPIKNPEIKSEISSSPELVKPAVINESRPAPSSNLADRNQPQVKVVPRTRVEDVYIPEKKNSTGSWLLPTVLIFAGVGLLVFAGWLLALLSN
ncbi:MAG: FHA domain-containing protein [Bacteroidetes bacterium]|nr:FHA domain-containing protein [Bacteroidota bacterium]